MRFDINETLLRHVATGGGAAFTLRKAKPDLPERIAAMFGARSDIRRLVRAQEVAEAILHVHDFGDIMELRKIVAQQELRRLIHYGKQQDHTAHTVYLYLLGVWFFDHVPTLQSAVIEKAGATGAPPYDWFLFQWMFASLLHDIGYAFFDLSADTKPDRERIDNMYSWEWLEVLLGPNGTSGRTLPPAALGTLYKIHEEWQTTYATKMAAATSHYEPGSRVKVLERLADAPWLGDLHEGWREKDVFDVLTLGPDADLRRFATEVAKHGYTKSGTVGYIDHAVASGVLLFQYVSYWYWLVDKLHKVNDKLVLDVVTGGHDYDLSKLRTWVVDACRAAAYHNVVRNVAGGGDILKRVTLAEQPVLYLAILCDELQVWDRYPAGDTVLQNFDETAATSLEGEDIELTCVGAETRTACFRIGHEKQTDLVTRRKETLKDKLPEYEEIVSVTEYVAPLVTSSTRRSSPASDGAASEKVL